MKFRIFDQQLGKMCYFDLSNAASYASLGYPVELFTGLLDREGKEIYEGDILVCKNYPFYGDAPEIRESSGLCEELNYVGIVEWFDEEASFYVGLVVVSDRVRGSACGGTISEYIDRAEVIGNIYENPELLNEST